MALDPSIALQYRGVELPNQLAQYAQAQQILAAQDAQQMNALKMEEARAAQQERNALRQLNPTAPDYEAQLFRVNPQLGIAYRKEQAATQAQLAAAAKSKFDLVAAQRKFGEDLKRGLSANPSDENIIAFGQDAVLQGLYTPEQVDATVKQLLALPVPDRVRILSQAGATAGELRPLAVGSSLMTPQGQVLATAPRQSQLLTPEEEAQKARIAFAGRAPAPPSAPVAVVDPATGKQIFVSREEALRNRMAPASAMEGLTPKEIQKREAALPQAKASVESFESKTDQFIKELENLRDDPGLDQITGSIYGRTPSVSREGSRAQAQYNKIFAKGGFQALQDLREASKTGGALGNVSNQEGERLERSIVGGLDRTQNIADVKQGINDLIENLKVSKARVRNTFDETYSYRNPQQTKALTPADQQALDWANANPKDPRAAQIKQRLGL